LAGNDFTGPIPETGMDQLSDSLNILNLSQNRFSGEIPSSIFQLVSVRELVLGGNDFVGTIDTTIGSMTSLSILSIEKSIMSGTLPADLFSLGPLLQELRLNDSNFQGPLIDQHFQQLTNLRILELQNNHFTGPLPIVAMEQSTSLQEIRLDGNQQLTGNVTETVCAKFQPGGLTVLRVGWNIYCRIGCCTDHCSRNLSIL
jgi:hypothetical protein